MQKNPTSKKRQLKRLANQLHQLILQSKGKTTEAILTLIAKMKVLVRQLQSALSASDLKKVLGAAALFFGLAGTQQEAHAQVFGQPITNPFGIQAVSDYIFPASADLDNDGDMDILYGDTYGHLNYYENTGSSTIAQFGAPLQVLPFGLDSVDQLAFPEFVDLDNDGDMDLMVGEYYGTLNYFENTGTANVPQFAAPITNPFGITQSYYLGIPCFVDLDGDGDFDLLKGEYYGNIQYQENIGTASNPNFAAQLTNPFGITQAYEYAFIDAGDLDNDGDYDLLVGEYYGSFLYFENTGSATIPQFQPAVSAPFGLDTLPEIAAPEFVDLDGDGDLDLIVGNYYAYGNLVYYENLSSIGISEENQSFEVNLYPNPVTNEIFLNSKENITQVDIFDLTGRVVFTVVNGDEKLNLSHLENGTYTIRMRNAANRVSVSKFVKS